jgi:Fic family protein
MKQDILLGRLGMTDLEPLNDQAIKELDGRYVPFPDFQSWQELPFNLKLWNEALASLESARAAEDMGMAREGVLRAAAISTGALEGLYTADRGFTMTVAEHASAWQQGVEERSPKTLNLYEAQLAGYNMALDAATKKVPIAEAWIRALHQVVTGPQEEYFVNTPAGRQSHPLPKGEYKKFPNHVLLKSGGTHSYAPVAETQHEMKRLVEVIASEAFQNAHSVRQASYVHYALTVIHPFADGNGRVARAVASVWLLRAISLPLVIFTDQAEEYLDSLARADQGDQDLFINVIVERSVDSILLALDLLHRMKMEAPEKSVARLNQLLTFQAGVPHSQMDKFAASIVQSLSGELNQVGSALGLPNEITLNINVAQSNSGESLPGYRLSISKQSSLPNLIIINITSSPPARAQISKQINSYISVDRDEAFPFILATTGGMVVIRYRLSEVRHGLTGASLQRTKYLAEEIITEILHELENQAKSSLIKAGFEIED